MHVVPLQHQISGGNPSPFWSQQSRRVHRHPLGGRRHGTSVPFDPTVMSSMDMLESYLIVLWSLAWEYTTTRLGGVVEGACV
jgi:hypothetical protein